MAELAVVSAFLVGLLGGVHCAAMCGGIVGAISFRGSTVAVHRTPPRTAHSMHHLAYSAGRIGSYTIAGMIAGGIGSGSLLFDDLFPVRTVLYLLASLMLLPVTPSEGWKPEGAAGDPTLRILALLAASVGAVSYTHLTLPTTPYV